jgi:hypothetical protein
LYKNIGEKSFIKINVRLWYIPVFRARVLALEVVGQPFVDGDHGWHGQKNGKNIISIDISRTDILRLFFACHFSPDQKKKRCTEKETVHLKTNFPLLVLKKIEQKKVRI